MTVEEAIAILRDYEPHRTLIMDCSRPYHKLLTLKTVDRIVEIESDDKEYVLMLSDYEETPMSEN